MTPLCSPTDVKSFSNVQSGYSGKDDAMSRYIETVSSQVRTFTRREFTHRERTQSFVSPEGSANGFLLKLTEPPIDPNEFFSVMYSPTADFREGYYAVIGVADMEIDYEEGDIKLHGFYQYNRKGIKVVYTGGYKETSHEGKSVLDVPPDVRAACAMQCAFMFRRAADGATGKISTALDTGKVDLYDRGGLTGLIREVSGPLLRYRRAMVGRS